MFTSLFCLSWIFNVFDEDGGGSIDLEEVHKLVLSLLQLTEAGDTGEESVQACIQVRDIMRHQEIESLECCDHRR